MLIVFSAPSGSGKSTLINYLMTQMSNLSYSISATSRAPRGSEKDGVEYYFLTPDEFRKKIEENAFLEYEEVYTDKYYGTLKEEVDARLQRGEHVVLDVDVKGAINIKKQYGDDAFLVFVQPPSVGELRKRLISRNTDAPEVIEQRVKKASQELTYASLFDATVVNDDLEQAKKDIVAVVANRLQKNK